ncbi:hypothetical protein VOLCADRAFT_105534 [Volvox carteri f. nagariensis]|uniref:Uncharacterized protein n=1 Tax=Volvox carteri f. nagariensis TaxID=3068 RepID=D8U1F6_VOLCA|nr:uncharacterized protein VOLCADRAFT_105534 [Volvox carteri f. nagariensis]EFJ46406.1 hypothetical protein VOLCADRAFT_105534 [Volvox carteri f. nagariensis]|eukprot:XP_002952559.1 hypothetical protein VOLCADRAFT_105534 [Volvox carteri f. nagariensis]
MSSQRVKNILQQVADLTPNELAQLLKGICNSKNKDRLPKAFQSVEVNEAIATSVREYLDCTRRTGQAVMKGRLVSAVNKRLGLKQTVVRLHARRHEEVISGSHTQPYEPYRLVQRCDRTSEETLHFVRNFWLANSEASPRADDYVRVTVPGGITSVRSYLPRKFVQRSYKQLYLQYVRSLKYDDPKPVSYGVFWGANPQWIKPFKYDTLAEIETDGTDGGESGLNESIADPIITIRRICNGNDGQNKQLWTELQRRLPEAVVWLVRDFPGYAAHRATKEWQRERWHDASYPLEQLPHELVTSADFAEKLVLKFDKETQAMYRAGISKLTAHDATADADDVEASEDADGFSAAKEEPEPEPGPESTLAQDVREAYVRDFAAAKESRTCFLSSSAAVLSAWREADLKRAPEFNCLPDAKAGWDLHLQRDGQHVLWWHQSLLQLFDLVSFRSRHLSADAFCSALLDTWEQNGIHRPVSISATTLRKRLRQALLLYMDCQGVVDDYLEGALSTWPRGALNGCPCCGDTLRCSSAVNGAAAAAPAPVTGAASPGVVEEAAAVEGPDPGLEHTEVAAGSPAATEGNPVPPVPPEAAGPGPTSLHSVHFDACFKLNLLSHKGYVSGYTQLGQRRYFLPNASIQQVPLDGHASQQIGVTHCSNFDADKVLAAESRKNLITAVGVALCRHGMLLRLMNLFSGERHAYSTAAALSFLAARTAVQYWWYDIACRWDKSYAKWLERQSPDLQRLGRGMRPLIPPWHRYAHSYTCQKAFGHLGVHGVGQGTGEPAHLERVARLYCRDVVRDLPARLWRMHTRAEAALDSARHRIRVLGAALEQKGGDAAVVQQSLQQQPWQLEAADVVPASPAAEYARCRFALQKLQREDTLDASSDAVRLGLLFPGADSVPVRQRPALIRTIKTRATDLEKAHAYDPAAWGPESELMSAALGSLAKGELRKLFAEAEDAVADMHALEHVVWRLSGRRHQQQLAIKEKRRARQRFVQLWEQLTSWSAVPGAVTPELGQALAMKGALGQALNAQRYPWAAQSNHGVPRLEASLRRVLQEEARCKEKLALI